MTCDWCSVEVESVSLGGTGGAEGSLSSLGAGAVRSTRPVHRTRATLCISSTRDYKNVSAA